jgi:hypothetical protein
MLHGDVPVMSGRLTTAVERQGVVERLTLSVPRWDGMDWAPADGETTHPLAAFGQELHTRIRVTAAQSSTEWLTRIGQYLVIGWEDDDDRRVTVRAESVLRRVLDDRTPGPLQPRPGGTFKSEARRLLPAGMSAAFDAGLVDRACPAAMTWSDDRLAALQEIANAWPARLRVDQWGQVVFKTPLPESPTPILQITDGERGTLVSAPRSDTREGRYNQVVASSSAPGAEDVQAVASITKGPLSVTGPYGTVTRKWSSPLLRNYTEALASARTMLQNASVPARIMTVEMAPDPRIELDDPVDIVRYWEDGSESHVWGWVTGVDLPLTYQDGPMRVDVGVAE